MPDWERIDPKLHEWTAERINPGEMCRRLSWDRKKRQTIVDRLRKLGLKEPAQSKPKRGELMSDETTEAPEVLPGHMSRETTDTPPHDPVSTIVDIVPVNEAQARPLTSLPPEQQREVWREVVETAPPSGITAKHVQEIVNRAKGKTTSPRAPKPKPKEPEPRRPARHEVQEGLAWCLSEVKDDEAWEVLEWLWDTLNGLASTYPTFRGVLDRIEPRFPDEHRPLRGLAYEREHADEEPATE